MNPALSFDDVLIVPKYSTIRSRKDVDTTSVFLNNTLRLPIIASNMDTVTDTEMITAMALGGGVACMHRFMSIEENVRKFFNTAGINTMVSVGVGAKELARAHALFEAGAKTIVLDVAHGAHVAVVEQTKALREIVGNNAALVVGNFASETAIKDFIHHAGDIVDAYKVGIGGGSACTTRVVTGCGLPTFASIIDCVRAGKPIIADGGCRTSGDISKALAAGASAVMLGGMLAGTDESPSERVTKDGVPYKKYRGSASSESYEVQGKTAEWRAAEGESYLVPYVGSVAGVLQQIEGGLRSAMSYVGAHNLVEFKELAEFAIVTTNGARENGAHGKGR